MKIRPVSSCIKRRRRSIDAITPFQLAKKDFKLLLSSTVTANYIDSQIFKLTDTSPCDPRQIMSTEVSQQLSMLKLCNNSSSISKHNKNTKIRRLSLELSEVSTAEIVGQKKFNQIQDNINNLEKEIKKTKDQQDDLLSNQEIYYHILKRLRTTKIFLDMKKHYLTERIKNKDFILNEVTRLKMKSSEEKTRNLKLYKDLNKTMDFFNRKNLELTTKYEKEKKIIDNLDANREERYIRQQDILEQVGVNEKNRSEKELHQELLLHKYWYLFLSKKLEDITQKFTTIDIAFHKIKSVTGLQDIGCLVEKFLTKEESLQDLTNLIRINKQTLESYSIRNAKLQKKINEISISDKNPITCGVIKQLNGQILSLNQRNSLENKKLVQLTSIKTTVLEWTEKMIRFLNPNFTYNKTETVTMLELIIKLKEKVRNYVKPLNDFQEIQNFDAYKSSMFITENPVSLRNKDKKGLGYSNDFNACELNFVETDSNDSKKNFNMKNDRKIKKK
ncbi:hypothetical protein SteCoe_21379 [Stentor coeruleus]|uniref:Uncharacterized protein n=1 Tax=Stentor coeruleus TaxID=5963 RepID=A0A1R2BPU2_9CILI|nr:hypothetical protein SteCoe_21379 [Stentor coeruleus]